MREATQLVEDTGSEVLASPAEHKAFQETIRERLGLETIDLRMGLDLARTQLQKGAADEAFRTYVSLVLCDPFDLELQAGLANCALLIHQYELALQAASAVVALAPSDPRGYYFSAKACIALGQHQEAREDLTDALELTGCSQDTSLKQEIQKLLAELEIASK